MSVLTVDDMADSTAWSAIEPDGTTSSAQLRVEPDPDEHGYGADRMSLRVSAEPGAEGHLLRRNLAAVDLRAFTELRISLRAQGRSRDPGSRFLLELRLASQARPLDDAATTWHRLLPVTGRWETVHCTLDDLPVEIAGAVTVVQLRCLQASWVAGVDDLVAATPQPLLDTDRALVSALGGITVGGVAVGAAVHGPDEDPPAAPGVGIRHVDVRPAPQRTIDAPVRRDYTATGSRMAAAGTPYDLDYVVAVSAGSRQVQAELWEAVLARLPADGHLTADGEPRPIRLLAHDRLDLFDADAPRPLALRYRVGARGPARVGPPVADVRRLELSTDLEVAG